ncbi:MAG: nitric oxide synthase [Burkholderiales bacterium]|nr:nitric oxide synthase [Burkholderiales bacterium]
MYFKLNILIGTMTGIAQLVAQEIELRLDGEGIAVDTMEMDELAPAVFDRDGIFLICTSTYGQGDVPDNAKDLYEALCTQRPDLSHVRYGVIALGDRTYAETFCFGGKRFDKILGDLGARRIGELMLHDASAGTLPEDEAAEWIEGWVALVDEQIRNEASRATAQS